MKTYFKLLVAIVSLTFIQEVKAQDQQTGPVIQKISSLIEEEINSGKVPALAVAVIDSGKVVHLSANGLRDVAKKEKATINTPFHVASVSKTVTNMAIFKLVESGKIDLTADINEYLPFEVKNPFFPNEIITVEHLLKHRSGIKDDHEFYGPHWDTPKGDPVLQLKGYLERYLVPGGNAYKKEHYDSRPNHKHLFKYSNTGITLLGLIVEHVSGMTYEEFCQENIFQPMKMNNSSWFLKHLDSALVAKTYIKSKSRGFIFKGHNGYPDYPAGQLRTSISDYSRLIAGYLNSEDNNFILSKSTTQLITPPQRSAQAGFFTWFQIGINNHLYYYHGGGDLGVRTISIIDPEKKRAIVIFANHPYAFDDLYRTIESHMWSN
ncbi:MAG: serine hydrolase [Roseivirga sp.]|nr:serine hydrolase [Roseivirga sp.]